MVISQTQSINVEHIPDNFLSQILPELNKNGGNVIDVEWDSDFGQWLITVGFEFSRRKWEHLVIYR